MKRILITGLCALVLLATGGLQIYKHYCAGELASVGLAQIHEEDCCGTTPAKDDCCKDETKLLKLNDLFIIGSRWFLAEAFSPISFFEPSLFIAINFKPSFHLQFPIYHPPTDCFKEVGMMVLHSTFRI